MLPATTEEGLAENLFTSWSVVVAAVRTALLFDCYGLWFDEAEAEPCFCFVLWTKMRLGS